MNLQTRVSSGDGRKAAAAKRLAELGLVDPTSQPSVRVEAAPRLQTLAGTRPGLLDNRKGNGDRLLDRVGELLVHQHGTLAPHRTTKWIYSRRAADELLDELAATCDFVITAVGD